MADATAVRRFRAVLSRHFGLQLDDTRLAALDELLHRRLAANKASPAAFLGELEDGRGAAELRIIAAAITVPETYFFRNIEQFHAFREVALPDRLRATTETKRLRILSAGCATGEEAFSLAILVRERLLDASWEVSITALDVNPEVLAKAARGRFSSWAMRETPPEALEKWFRREGSEHVLDESIRSAVRFKERNLSEPDAWLGETYDIIFWRNVMMYFTPETQRAVLANIARALPPGGYLFLGYAETLRGISEDFELRNTHGTFYYQRRPARESRSEVPPSPPPTDSEPTAVSWVEAIATASRRIQALTQATAHEEGPNEAVTATGGPPLQTVVAEARGLLRKERFADALLLLESLPSGPARDPSVLLLRAALLTHEGQLAVAEKVCAELLSIDALDAGAHYLLALCREGVGDRRGALEHDRLAARLDPGFAMPRLHMGLLSRRAGEWSTARRELSDALRLLEREDAARLLLFGGGFERDALLSLCRGEIATCAGRS